MHSHVSFVQSPRLSSSNSFTLDGANIVVITLDPNRKTVLSEKQALGKKFMTKNEMLVV
jgi:hypothetical protein